MAPLADIKVDAALGEVLPTLTGVPDRPPHAGDVFGLGCR